MVGVELAPVVLKCRKFQYNKVKLRVFEFISATAMKSTLYVLGTDMIYSTNSVVV